jgi:hypothetical protein
MREYKIIIEININSLIMEVNRHLRNGWICLGGVTVLSYDTRNGAAMATKYGQAMVKE